MADMADYADVATTNADSLMLCDATSCANCLRIIELGGIEAGSECDAPSYATSDALRLVCFAQAHLHFR